MPVPFWFIKAKCVRGEMIERARGVEAVDRLLLVSSQRVLSVHHQTDK